MIIIPLSTGPFTICYLASCNDLFFPAPLLDRISSYNKSCLNIIVNIFHQKLCETGESGREGEGGGEEGI